MGDKIIIQTKQEMHFWQQVYRLAVNGNLKAQSDFAAGIADRAITQRRLRISRHQGALLDERHGEFRRDS
jgi:hypothetical protein